MRDNVIIIWRDEPGQLISVVSDGNKHPKRFQAEDLPDGVQFFDQAEAEELIKRDTFERSAVSCGFAQSVLGWDV